MAKRPRERAVSKTPSAQSALRRRLRDEAAFLSFVEDVYVNHRHPGTGSVRALAAEGEVILYGTDAEALNAVYAALTNGATVKGRRVRRPTDDEILSWLADARPDLLE